jgi:hypothetical protein
MIRRADYARLVAQEARAESRREDGWLMISIPELDLLTQAEHWGEVTLMARDVIACELGTSSSTTCRSR